VVIISFITKNSYSKMESAPVSLREVLESVVQVPFRSVILVDDSDDVTPKVFLDWCCKHGKELVVVRGAGNRAVARQLAIEVFTHSFNDDWLMFVDDDVILNEGWWGEARNYLSEPGVGLIWGLNYDGYKEKILWLKVLGVDYVSYLIREFYHRGGTHDTMLRREAIEDIKIPSDLHVFEDWYILRHVIGRGYKVRIVKAGVTHYNPWPLPTLKDLKLMAELAMKYGIDAPSIPRLLKSAAGLPLNMYIGVKGFGIRSGLRRGLHRWWTKVVYRYLLLTLSSGNQVGMTN